MMKTILTKNEISGLRHTFQPTPISCGPTCLFMVIDFILNKQKYPRDIKSYCTVDEICEACGTDSIVGTPPERMQKGLDAFNIKYVEYFSPKRPYDLIKQIINSQNIPIVRTITKNVPHWIIIKGYSEDKFHILDPWLGEITYTTEELDSIWKVRNYQFFEILCYYNHI